MSAKPKDEPSGKFIIRLPRTLHAKIRAVSEVDGVSMNDWITYALAEKYGEFLATVKFTTKP